MSKSPSTERVEKLSPDTIVVPANTYLDARPTLGHVLRELEEQGAVTVARDDSQPRRPLLCFIVLGNVDAATRALLADPNTWP